MSKISRLDPDFYRHCLRHLAEVGDLEFIVPNSLPIPYFGDLAAYLASPHRVLTAALNPSNREFPDDAPRFDVGSGRQGAAELETQLSAYFSVNPYRQWFSSFEPVLNGLDASYGAIMANGDYPSTALHVDMCSPIATSPTWSKLTAEQRVILTEPGRKIFEWLIDELEPDIIVASLGWGHIEGWHADFQDGRNWEHVVAHGTTAGGAPLRTRLLVQSGAITTKRGRPLLFVNASAANKPFGRFTTDRKFAAGQQLLQQLGQSL
jgi:hypothetical protein